MQDLNLQTLTATLIPVALDYYTEPLRETSVQVLSMTEQTALAGAAKAHGDLLVTTHVVGFRKRRWGSGENLAQEPLDLPPTDLHTTGYWITIADSTVQALARDGLWTNAPNDYGPQWPVIRNAVRARDNY
ncbi:MAG: hypothetical protein WHV44_04385, partial [Anaerolineales bacterium]